MSLDAGEMDQYIFNINKFIYVSIAQVRDVTFEKKKNIGIG